MKKQIPAILLTLILAACFFPFSALAAPAEGTAILLPPDAGEAEQAAAAVLGEYMEKITGTLIPLIVSGYSRRRGVTAGKCITGAAAACVLAGAFTAVLMVLSRNMLNGLDSHLAYFTVCLVLEGVALLGLLLLLPCAFFKKRGKTG